MVKGLNEKLNINKKGLREIADLFNLASQLVSRVLFPPRRTSIIYLLPFRIRKGQAIYPLRLPVQAIGRATLWQFRDESSPQLI